MSRTIRMVHRMQEQCDQRTQFVTQGAQTGRVITMKPHDPTRVPMQGATNTSLWSSVTLPSLNYGVEAFVQVCEDGVSFRLDCKEDTLLTGASSVRGIFLSMIIDNACASNIPVMILTPSGGNPNDYLYDARDVPVHRVDSLSFSGGFAPFSGWSMDRIVDYLQSVMVTPDHRSGPFQRRILQSLLTLCRMDPFVSSGVTDGSLYSVHAILEHFDNVPQNRDVDMHCGLLREDIPSSNQAIAEIHDFMRFCAAEGTGQAPWTLLSPGITLINATSSDAYEGQRGGSWYLKRMLPYLIDDMTRLNRPVLLVADCVPQNVLNGYMPLLQCANTKLVLVTNSIMDLDPGLRGRATRQIVFCQTDGQASSYWAERTGTREQLKHDWSHTHSVSRKHFEFGKHVTDSDTEHFDVERRPNYESSDFSALSVRQGFLFAGVNGDPCHRFYYEY